LKTNEILSKIQKALTLTNSEILEAYKLADYEMSEEHLLSLLTSDKESGFVECSYEELGLFLDGFIILRRGPNPKKQKSTQTELTNNLILKKLRIALELKEAETEIIFSLGEVELSKQQLASLFRNTNNKNYKECSDELLMGFLDGIDEFYFTTDTE